MAPMRFPKEQGLEQQAPTFLARLRLGALLCWRFAGAAALQGAGGAWLCVCRGSFCVLAGGSLLEDGLWKQVRGRRRRSPRCLAASRCISLHLAASASLRLEDSSACLRTFVVQRAPPSGSSHSQRSGRWSTRHLTGTGMPGKERESVGHFHAFTPVQLEPMLWKIFVELSGDAFATEDTSPVWGAAPEIPVRCFPGGEEHRRRRDLLRSWRSWGEPFQREGARGAAAHKKSLSLCSAPPLAVLILGKAAKHPTSPGRTGIPFAQRVSDRLHLALHGTAWHCMALHGTAVHKEPDDRRLASTAPQALQSFKRCLCNSRAKRSGAALG